MQPEAAPRVFFFGCWNEAGHFMHQPGARRGGYSDTRRFEYYGDQVHIDGTLAPRRMQRDRRTRADGWLPPGSLCWRGQGRTPQQRDDIEYTSQECPQGQFLLHHLDTGFTAISWWDRCQGDTRGGCNSTLLLEGVHTSDEMLAALREYFPHVLANLERHGVKLLQVEVG